MSDREGVEIDYCPQCRGVWLDRGELDKIIERSAAYEQQYTRPAPAESKHRDYRDTSYSDYDYDDDHHRHPDRSYPPGKRKRSFLGDMFDIFD
jgi:Zn-finger nucleic acid-binding protein